MQHAGAGPGLEQVKSNGPVGAAMLFPQLRPEWLKHGHWLQGKSQVALTNS